MSPVRAPKTLSVQNSFFLAKYQKSSSVAEDFSFTTNGEAT